MKISEHFHRSEFECKCGCNFDTVDIELNEILETVRHYFMRPVIITSGCRCPNHNYQIGGSENSQHLYGKAADIMVQGVSPREVHDFLCRTFKDKYGFGLYESAYDDRGWNHVDSRSTKARWDG